MGWERRKVRKVVREYCRNEMREGEKGRTGKGLEIGKECVGVMKGKGRVKGKGWKSKDTRKRI